MKTALWLLLLPLAAHAGDFKRLYAESARASSFLKSNWNKYEENYHPNYALDDDPKTAWVEGNDGLGEGESWTVEVSPLKKAARLKVVVFNGYQKSKPLLAANGAPKSVLGVAMGPTGKESARFKLELKKDLGPQTFVVPLKAGLARVTLTIEAAHPGTKYQDTCLSDVQLFVDSSEPYSAGVEKGKLAALKRWKADRLGAAKYYSSLPQAWPYAATHFVAPEPSVIKFEPRHKKIIDGANGLPEGIPVEGWEDLEDRLKAGKGLEALSAEQRALVAKLMAHLTKPGLSKWYSFEVKQATRPPEGFPLHESLEALIHPGDATLFEATGIGKTTAVPRGKPMEDFAEGTALSNAMLFEGTPTDPRLFYVVWSHTIVERNAFTEVHKMLVRAEGGKLKTLVAWETNDDEFAKEKTLSVLTPTWTADGKVNGFERVRYRQQEGIAEIGGATPQDGIHIEREKWTPVPST